MQLDGLPGIDLEAGLRVTQQNEQLYRRLLVKFYKNYQEFENIFQQKLEQDLELARKEAHSLKGVAANLGIQGVYELSLALEKSCAENKPELIKYSLKRLLCELDLVLTGLSRLAQNPDETLKPTQLSLELDLLALETVLKELMPLVKGNDFSAREVVKKLPMVAQDTEFNSKVQKLIEALEGYDFDLAQQIILSIMQQKDIV